MLLLQTIVDLYPQPPDFVNNLNPKVQATRELVNQGRVGVKNKKSNVDTYVSVQRTGPSTSHQSRGN